MQDLSQKSKRELLHILENSSDRDLKNKAGELLASQSPGSLDMSRWHCGTSHCLAGHACVLNEDVMKVEREHSTEIAGAAALPNYAHLFFSDNDTVLEVLKSIRAKSNPQ